ncbi:MAG: small subunit ribosomal protein [Actinomycetota bacterium]|jgi:small subunit ribosomal protein S8|nr:small subunit ribosomal protein [Actinomycetota bacterium]MEA2487684.1 small subunit ribosomal protein [Actinomycetota bacterium]
MTMTDPIADMLTRVRNASSAMHDEVTIPDSKIKQSIAQILADEGYVDAWEVVTEEPHPMIRIRLRYPERERAILGIRRISKPGRRVYRGAQDLPRVLGGLGVAIISTSQGVMTDKQARRANVGGEVLAYVW